MVDREWTTMNAWEDPDFRGAVERWQRKKLIVAGLRTEVCVAFPVVTGLVGINRESPLDPRVRAD